MPPLMKNLIPIWLLGKLFMERYGESYTDSYTCRQPLTLRLDYGLEYVVYPHLARGLG
jgi:hypothetical protein